MMRENYTAPEDPDDDVCQRGGVGIWFEGATPKEFQLCGNDFAGKLLFWQAGALRMEGNIFHGPTSTTPHIEVTGVGDLSACAIEVTRAPPWLRTGAKSGGTVNVTYDAELIASSTERLKAAAASRKDETKPGGIRRGRVNYIEDEDESESDDANELTIEDLHEAAEAGDRAKLRKILQVGVGVDVMAPEGATALMLAAQKSKKPCVKLLLQHNAKVDMRDADGWSALMFAAKADDADIVNLLCEADADMEIKEKAYGMTAFLIACENGCPEAVEALAECGANIKAKDDVGNDGRKLAAQEEPPHENVLEVLKEIKQLSKPKSQQEEGSKKPGRQSNSSVAAAADAESEEEADEAPEPTRERRIKGSARVMVMGAVKANSGGGRSRSAAS